MKVKLEDVKANPYRNIEHYPISAERVAALVKSINQTGFWDNLVGREHNGEIQIAYGHHRINALRFIKNHDFEIEIPIKPLTNEMMLQIMANENMQEYDSNSNVIDETVKQTIKFLENNKEIALTYCKTTTSRNSVGRSEISPAVVGNFLGWTYNDGSPNDTVYDSFSRIKAMESPSVKVAAIKKVGTKDPAKATAFAKAVQEYDIPKDLQTKVANKIVAEDVSSKKVRETVKKEYEDFFRDSNPDEFREPTKAEIQKFKTFYKDIDAKADEFTTTLIVLGDFTDELKNVPYKDVGDVKLMLVRLLDVKREIENVMTKLKG